MNRATRAARVVIRQPMRALYKRSAGVLAVALILLSSPWATCGTVVLKKAFVAKYKDRATIDATFLVDHAHKKPNAPSKDGDMHVAGRAPKEVGLPMVAEVINAARKEEQAAVNRIHAVEGNGTPVPISGAWRLWFEHPANSQTQFADFPIAGNTNPDHSFEIHPITKFDSNDLSSSFQPIPGFEPYAASKAFASYESLTFTVSATSTAIILTSKKSGYNYTQFRMQLKGAPTKLDDGGFAVLADVFDTGSKETEDSVAENVRMIFVPDTAPTQMLASRKLGDGDSLNVIGIPRVNLNAVFKFVCPDSPTPLTRKPGSLECASSARPATRKLPYEMIIISASK
jgi:hypothetical protein